MSEIQDNQLLQKAFDAARQLQDFADLQREIAGVEVGRTLRFFTGQSRKDRLAKQRKRAWREALTRLQQLLANDPIYAARYTETDDMLRHAETVAARILATSVEAKDAAESHLADLLARAATLPDGTKVFQDEDGQVWTEHGSLVSSDQAASIVWQGTEPTYEAYSDAVDLVEKTDQQTRAIERYQIDVLGRARDRLDDQNEPPSMEELDQIQKDIIELAPPHLNLNSVDTNAAANFAPPSNSGIPKL